MKLKDWNQGPHASAEIRRLRNATLVDSDMPAGSRVQTHLTEAGWLAIKSDELALAASASYFERRGHLAYFSVMGRTSFWDC